MTGVLNLIDDLIARRRGRLAGALLLAGSATFWASWALMPMPGTNDPRFILEAVAAARTAVLASCILQLVSAAVWVAGLVLMPGPEQATGRLAWWLGAAMLAAGMTASAADAIYHLIAYELTHPDVTPAMALAVMTRIQGPDLLLLLPGVGAFFLGLLLLAVAGVRTGLLPRRGPWLMAAAVPIGAARIALPGIAAPRVAGLMALACLIAPAAWMGWRLTRGHGERDAWLWRAKSERR